MTLYRYKPDAVDAEQYISGNEAQRIKFDIQRGSYPFPPYIYDLETYDCTTLFEGMWLIKHRDGSVTAETDENFHKKFEAI